MTWRDLIKLTLEDLSVYGQNVSAASANDQESCRLRLNDWIDWLKTQRLSLYRTVRTTWALTGAASYTVGTGGVVNVARPPGAEFIVGLGYVDQSISPEFEVPLGNPFTDQEYRQIAFKALTANYPQGYYYERTFNLALLKPWPIPTASNLLGVMYSGVPVEELAADDMGDTIFLPPGYRLAIRKCMRIECAPAFKIDVKQDWKDEAGEALGAIKRVNEGELSEISFGAAGVLFGGGGAKSNIYTGDA